MTSPDSGNKLIWQTEARQVNPTTGSLLATTALSVVVEFDPTDPVAVQLRFYPGEESETLWTFAREHLNPKRRKRNPDDRLPPPDWRDVVVKYSHIRRRADLTLSTVKKPEVKSMTLRFDGKKMCKFYKDTLASVPRKVEGDLIGDAIDIESLPWEY